MKRIFVSVLSLAIFAVVVIISPATADGAGSASSGKDKKKQSSKKSQYAGDPLYALTLMRQGSVLMQQGLLEEAIEAFEQADRIAPGNATVHNMLGLCSLRLGNLDDGLASFNRALLIIPGFTDARNNRGVTYLSMGQYHLAEVDFIAVLGDSTYPHRKQVYFNLGLTYLRRDQFGAAENNFRRAIITPNPVAEAYVQLAGIAQRRDKLEIAEDFLLEAIFNFPERTDLAFELGKLLMIMGRNDDARPYLERVIADAPGSESAAMAKSLLGTG
jgi:tetratricopeptide (TPR) repeat protein